MLVINRFPISLYQYLFSCRIPRLSKYSAVLFVLLVTQSIRLVIRLAVQRAEKSITLTFIRQLHIIIQKRIFGTDWHRLKLLNRDILQQKIDDTCIIAVRSLMKSFFTQLKNI